MCIFYLVSIFTSVYIHQHSHKKVNKINIRKQIQIIRRYSTMHTKITAITTILLSLVTLLVEIHTKQIFLHHDQRNQQIQIYKFFYDLNKGYYVDIGAYDPVFISNTINLYSRGWNGINIQANPNRFSQFPVIKPFDVNINLAISDQEKYLTFYEYSGDQSQSTAKEDVYKSMIKNRFTTFQVPSMSMKQICYRYFKKKPNFLSIDVQGFSTIALNSNDWNNTICRPQIMMVQKDNIPNTINFTVLHKQMMQKIGYRFHSQFWYNEIYIQNSVYEHYMQKYQTGNKIFQNQKIPLKWQDLLPQFYKKFTLQQIKPNIISARSLSNTTHGHFYYYYPKQGTTFVLQDINRQSNQFSDLKNRPILILLYNKTNTFYVIQSEEYKKQIFEVNKNNKWLFQKIYVKKDDGEKFQVYIFDSVSVPYVMKPSDGSSLGNFNNVQTDFNAYINLKPAPTKNTPLKPVEIQKPLNPKPSQNQIKCPNPSPSSEPQAPTPTNYTLILTVIFFSIILIVVANSVAIKLIIKKYKDQLNKQLQLQNTQFALGNRQQSVQDQEELEDKRVNYNKKSKGKGKGSKVIRNKQRRIQQQNNQRNNSEDS